MRQPCEKRLLVPAWMVKPFECDQNVWDAGGGGVGRIAGGARHGPWGDEWAPPPPRRPRRAVRPASSAPMGQPRPHEVHTLLASVRGPDARAQTAAAVASTRCRRRLAWGAARGRRVWVTRAAGRPAESVTAPEGTRLSGDAQRPPPDEAVVGHGRGGRHACTAPGPEGRGPREAERSWPAPG